MAYQRSPEAGALRPLRLAVFSALLAAFAACGKKEPGSPSPDPQPSPVAASAPSPAAVPAGRAAAPAGESAPSWVRERPHFFDLNGRRFASAVGRARVGNLALARTTAQDRARADLLRLIQGQSAGAGVKGILRGARVTDIYSSRRGQVYVRVEVPSEAQ